MTRQYYIQLEFNVIRNPLIKKMPLRFRWATLELLVLFLESDELGVLLLSEKKMAQALSMRLETYEEFIDTLEECRFIFFRKADHAIIVNPRLLPQIDKTSQDGVDRVTSPRVKSPEQLAAQAERQRRSRQIRKASQAKTEPTPETQTPLQQFFSEETVPPRVTNPCDNPVTDPSVTTEPESLKEKKENQSQSLPPTPRVTVTASEGLAGQALAGQAFCMVTEEERREVEIALIAEGVKGANASAIAKLPDLCPADVTAQIAALKFRAAKDPPGMLVKALREKWPLPPEYLATVQAKEVLRLAEAEREERLKQSDIEMERYLAGRKEKEKEDAGLPRV